MSLNGTRRARRLIWVQGAKDGLNGANFSMSPYPMPSSTDLGGFCQTIWKAREWARGYWWSQRCLQGVGKRVQLHPDAALKVKAQATEHLKRLSVAAQHRSTAKVG